jgi:hypothetical protein
MATRRTREAPESPPERPAARKRAAGTSKRSPAQRAPQKRSTSSQGARAKRGRQKPRRSPVGQSAPQGAPSKLLDVVGKTKGGADVTRGDRIVQAMRAGNYLEAAAAMAGVHKTTAYDWLSVGAAANALLVKAERGESDPPTLTEHEQACAAFANAVAQAEAESEVESVAKVDQLAAGGLSRTITTEKVDAEGNVVERTTRVETLHPDLGALTWRLERRHPDKWGRRRIEVSGPDGEAIPIETRATALAEALRTFQSGSAPQPAVEDDDGSGDG